MMSSINDVLKEKFGVTGSNIAETLSKITPGEGGGSGSGTGWLVVNVTESVEDGKTVSTLDKTAGEIMEAWPFVICMNDTWIDLLWDKPTVDDTYAPEKIYYHFQLGELDHVANGLNDYPRYTGSK